MRPGDKGLVYWSAIMAGLSYVGGAVVITDVLGKKWAGLLIVGIGALQTGTAAYVAGRRSLDPPLTGTHVH